MHTRFLYLFIFLLGLGLSFSACEAEFDQPPLDQYQSITPNSTVADLVALHQIGAPFSEITEDIIIQGIVVADDRSGNFYKGIIIQDETGGIEVRINAIDLFLEYPIGSEVSVRCQGLYIGDYNGKPQLGGDPENGIAEPLMGEYVFPGPGGNKVEPKEILDISQLGFNDLNTLVKLDGMEFINDDAGQSYAFFSTGDSKNAILTNCVSEIILRTSGFSSFAANNTPTGNGSVTAIYSVFGSDPQLVIRDTTDLAFDGPRCSDKAPDFYETFNNVTLGQPINLPGWTIYNEAGTATWEGSDWNGNFYARINPFGSGDNVTKCWMISPEMNLDNDKYLNFNTEMAFWEHLGLEILISTNFDGSNVLAATWEPLNGATYPNSSSDWYTWFNSGNVDLSNYTGNTAHIAWLYTGNDGNNSTLFDVDEIKVIPY